MKSCKGIASDCSGIQFHFPCVYSLSLPNFMLQSRRKTLSFLNYVTQDSFYFQQFTETVSPSELPASALPLDLLNNAVTAFSTLEDLIRYLEPDRWQLDLEDLYRPTWQLLGKAFVFGRKSRGKLSLQIRTSCNSFSS